MSEQRLGDRFTLLEQIGRGSRSEVWKATEEMGHGIRREVAVKILHGLDLTKSQTVEAFRHEAELLVQLGQHPNIVQTLSFDIDPERGPWIVMEYQPKSLHDIIGTSPENPSMVRQMLHDVLMGLNAMHSSDPPIVHWDLKPANILVSSFGFQIADFGLAWPSDTAPTLSPGSTRYAPPEVLDQADYPAQPSADLYSLGFVASELALGRTLFRQQFSSIYDPDDTEHQASDELLKWMAWHSSPEARLRPIADILPDFPNDLSDVISRLVAKALDERYASASEALRDLGRSAGALESPGEAPAPEPVEPPPTDLLKYVAIGTLLVLAGALAVWGLRSGQPPVIVLDDNASFSAAAASVPVTGRVADLPEDAAVFLVIGSSDGHELSLDEMGEFEHAVPFDRLDSAEGAIQVRVGAEVLARQALTVKRVRPTKVSVEFVTDPPVPNASIRVHTPDYSRELASLTTDENGKATAEIRFGKFRVSLNHEDSLLAAANREHDTGIDPRMTMTLATSSKLRTVAISVMPTSAAVLIAPASAPDRMETIPLDDAGTGTVKSRIGDYILFASAEGYTDQMRRFTVSASEAASVRLTLREVPPIEEAPVTNWNILSLPDPQSIEEAKLMALPYDDFRRYIEHHAPLSSLLFDDIAELDKLRVKGTVLNQAELDTLLARLGTALVRLQVEVKVDERDVCRRLQAALEAAGGEDVKARPSKRNDLVSVRIEFTRSDTLEADRALELCESYVLDRSLIEIFAY